MFLQACRENEIIWSSSILDLESYNYMLKYDPYLIKLPSTISNHRNFLKKVASQTKIDIVVSTGYTDKEYENFILENFKTVENLFLLQCVSSYPAPPESCQISVIRHYSRLRNLNHNNIVPGYSSHDVGSLASQLAVAAGAKMIETCEAR